MVVNENNEDALDPVRYSATGDFRDVPLAMESSGDNAKSRTMDPQLRSTDSGAEYQVVGNTVLQPKKWSVSNETGNSAVNRTGDLLDLSISRSGDEEKADIFRNDSHSTGRRNNRNSSSVKKSKTISTKVEADWVKSLLPQTLKGESGFWKVVNRGAGFEVCFRVGKPKLNLSFPYISRETFLTWKGLSNAEAKHRAEKYVRGHITDAIASGNDKARIIAGKLRNVA